MKTFLYLSVFLLLLSNNSSSQATNIKFNPITGEDGVSLGKINGITQDPNGYIWLADQTQKCITRYDGYNMISFRNNPLNKNSLGGTYPECILADSTGIIWIGFFGMGLDYFDPETNTFKHFRHQPNDPQSLSNDTVTCVLMDHLGNLWVGTYSGLELLDIKTGKFKHFPHKANDPVSLSSNHIRALYEDKQGTLWIGCGSVFDNEPSDEGGLNRFNRETGTFTRYLHDPQNRNSLINNKVRAIFEDSRGTFWVGTAGDGLHTLDRTTGVFKRYTYNPSNPKQLSRPPVKDAADHITFITEDKTEAIWIGVFNGGLLRYDPVTKTLTTFNVNTSKSSGFIENSCWAAYTSKDNVLWVSTEPTNLYTMDPFHITIPHISTAGGVNSFLQKADGALWIGTDSGLICNYRNKKISKRFMHDAHDPHSISSDHITGIAEDPQGNLWIGTNGGGLNKYDTEKKIFTHYKHDAKTSSSLINDVIFKTYVDREGLLWIGTVDGLDKLNMATGIFTHYQNNPNDTNSLSNNLVTDIFQDKQKRLWVATHFVGGLNTIDSSFRHFKHYLAGVDVNSVYQDLDGTIWAGAIDGLYRFDSNSDTFMMFADPRNATRFNNVMSIVEDERKDLWIGTSSGIVKLNPQRNKSTIYNKNDGVENNLNFISGYIGLNDELFFGAVTGYYNFFPGKLITDNQPPQIVLSDFRIRDKPVTFAPQGLLQQPLSKTKKIKLKYNQNSFSFSYAAIDYSNPAENKHLFMLENYDNNWRQGNERKAYYFNVPPGHYIFHVKAANSNGIWSEKSIIIIITPPWWLTWWAYTLFTVLAIAILWIFIKWRVRHLRRTNKLLEEKVKMRTTELQKQKEKVESTLFELKSAQAQLIQSEKMASFGKLAAGIAHEIQNPLNFVNNFLEVNTELITDMKTELLSGNTEEAVAIANDIKENEQKVIAHGKRAGAIVKGMMLHLRASTGIKELTDINLLVDECLRLSYPIPQAKNKTSNIIVKKTYDPNAGEINIIHQDIARVLLNLFNNAFYSLKEKEEAGIEGYKPTLTVSTKIIPPSSDKLREICISVQDNGMGISKENLSKIFQPFFTTKPSGEGTGLGLWMSSDIIKAHGGEIKVESKEGEGSEFVILLPIV